MTLLPWALLATTIAVREAISRKHRWGFYLDLATVPFWLTFYVSAGAYPLLAVPLYFGYLDVRALTKWWKPIAARPEEQR